MTGEMCLKTSVSVTFSQSRDRRVVPAQFGDSCSLFARLAQS
ncbi:hypothetical protein R52603_03222 [Paraburkholderia saeva]|jgi:hypothetical protein|uniref:Uncharacterized protein n=1 Tax=Paraburkholderia saeva TaxID=2777537 RepID=A0A9N8X4U4_9BURK|nr:hypothetical protein R70241_00770 [Paraburkholderia saeva]CAG4904588.1 hypothetical protein R52603_03222 [Paraburkholderia saeva]CAG4915604.1 hypothetical protein LMG31841_04495 [Paraburkholderia saeva]